MDAEKIDLVIVGAGPAGLSAACEARRWGLEVVLLDEQNMVGGQIYRGITHASARKRAVLGKDYVAGAALATEFSNSGARYIGGASVWNVGRDLQVNFIHAGSNRVFQARHIVLASGAMERPFPIPGWTLPGVMGAGAAQVLYKDAAALPTEPLVLGGCGPLLYLLASQYLEAGVALKAVVTTTRPADYLRGLREWGAAVRGWKDLHKGLGLLRSLRRHKVPVYSGATNLAAVGEGRVEALDFSLNGKPVRIDTRLLLLHQGVVPNIQLSQSLRVEHRWNDAQLCWQPQTDEYGQIGQAGIFIAGDSRAIVGARASAIQGRLAAMAISRQLKPHREQDLRKREREAFSELKSHLQIRPFLDALYRPAAESRIPADDSVVVCRCEEVNAGQIRKYAELGCQGPNQTKAFGRCGMGPCQGRLCGLSVTEILAQAHGRAPQDVGYYRIRPPIKPVTLNELAG